MSVDNSITILSSGGIIMICVGIDVAKDKHDCFILSSDGEVLADVFTVSNNLDGFETLLHRIRSCALPTDIKVGLEATGHYSYNILGFLLDKGLATYVINPLHTNLYRKSLSLRQTKQIVLMRGRLHLCSCLMWTSSPTQTQHTTTRS